MPTLEITAKQEPDTKRKRKYSAEAPGVSIGIYIDKMLQDVPEEILIRIPKS